MTLARPALHSSTRPSEPAVKTVPVLREKEQVLTVPWCPMMVLYPAAPFSMTFRSELKDSETRRSFRQSTTPQSARRHQRPSWFTSSDLPSPMGSVFSHSPDSTFQYYASRPHRGATFTVQSADTV